MTSGANASRNGDRADHVLRNLRKAAREMLRRGEDVVRFLEELDFRLEEIEDLAWSCLPDGTRFNGRAGSFEDLSPQARAALRRLARAGGLGLLEILSISGGEYLFRIDGRRRLVLPEGLGRYLLLVARGGGAGRDLWGTHVPPAEVAAALGCSAGALKTRTWRLRGALWRAVVNPYYLEVHRTGIRLRLGAAPVWRCQAPTASGP